MNSLKKVRLALRNKQIKRPILFTKKTKKTCNSKLGVVHFITQMIKRTEEQMPIQNIEINIIPYSKRVIKFIQLLSYKIEEKSKEIHEPKR
jgi:hypothetical protein